MPGAAAPLPPDLTAQGRRWQTAVTQVVTRMVSTESQATATPCSPHARQWTTGRWAQDPCPATPKRPQQPPRLAHQEWGPAPCSLATSVWGAQGRASFRAPVGQEEGHRCTCRPHAPPHRASHDKAHGWGPGEQALTGPVHRAQGQGSLGVARARFGVCISSRDSVVCLAWASSSPASAWGPEAMPQEGKRPLTSGHGVRGPDQLKPVGLWEE